MSPVAHPERLLHPDILREAAAWSVRRRAEATLPVVESTLDWGQGQAATAPDQMAALSPPPPADNFRTSVRPLVA